MHFYNNCTGKVAVMYKEIYNLPQLEPLSLLHKLPKKQELIPLVAPGTGKKPIKCWLALSYKLYK